MKIAGAWRIFVMWFFTVFTSKQI